MASLVSQSLFDAEGNPIYRFTTFSGADIVAAIGDKVFGNIQAIQYAVQREVAPVYVMGAANPLAYSRGRRAVTGSLVFINFNKDALLEHIRSAGGLFTDPLRDAVVSGSGRGRKYKWGVNVLQALTGALPWSPEATVGQGRISTASSEGAEMAWYADQIPPFHITISFLNEMGNTAHMRIEGVQIVNEGMGMSIDDVVLEKACTFIARKVVPLTRDLAQQAAS